METVNLALYDFKEDIVNVINKHQLSPIIAQYILKDVLSDLQNIANNQLQNELKTREKENKAEIVKEPEV